MIDRQAENFNVNKEFYLFGLLRRSRCSLLAMTQKTFYNKQNAFTLAEILITLAIIGVVSALTIPTLIQKANEKETITGLKKAYSTLSQAYTMAVNENGTPDTWGMPSNSYDKKMISYILPYLKVRENCIDGGIGCWPSGVNYKYLTTSRGYEGVMDSMNEPKLALSDGLSLSTYVDNGDCHWSLGTSLALQNICGRYLVDINGIKGPNQWGKDFFIFFLTKYGIVPLGEPQQTGWLYFDNDCRDKDNAYGLGCAAWIIYNENMDYLHCNNLSWDGPTKCN